MQSYTYLLINFLSVIVCFIFSFHRKIKFNRHFLSFIKSSVLVALFFLAWDIWFTDNGVWWFNDHYLIGFRIMGLPIEEILFFFCIPFSCLFTYFCLVKFYSFKCDRRVEKYCTIGLIVFFLVLAVYYDHKIYTLITLLTTALTLIVLYFFTGFKSVGRATIIYLLLMPGFLVVNGVLTGTGLESPIVNYNPRDFIGLRILTIPIEDAIYGYELILWNIYFFEKFKGVKEMCL